MKKSSIQRFAIWARTELIDRVSQRAYQYDITKDGYGNANAETVSGRPLTPDEQRQRRELVEQIRQKGYTQVMEEVAYTWFNRFIALRFMEVNNYLPSHTRVFSDSTGAFKPEILEEAMHLDLPGLEKDKVLTLLERNQTEDLYRYLLLTQCNALNEALPGMFERMGGYTEMLLPNNILRQDSVLGHMVSDIPEEDWQDAVQIIGWLYQYYNTELKDDTFAQLKKNVKITKERIPSATQLFTPDWIVRYMVENSLGRLWLEGHPNAELHDGWKYYLDEAEQERSVEDQLAKLREEYKTIKPEAIKVIDPCMGSGHILVYAFDVLMQIYEANGYSQRDAAQSILKNNLYGLDIDDRAAQLAYFAVMMKARQYDRRLLTRGIQPNIFSIRESNGIQAMTIEYFHKNDPKLKADIESIVTEMRDAKEYGSILNITPVDFTGLYARFDEIRNDINMMQMSALENLLPVVKCAEVLAQKYDVVVTNPPYMGASGMNARLAEYVKSNYPNTKSDMSTVFMEKTVKMCKKAGYMSMINIPVWMFLSSYEKLRESLIAQDTFANMVHFGRGVFGSDFGTTAFVIAKAHINGYKGTYCRLFEKQGAVDSVETKEKWFLEGMGRFVADQSNFSKIPGSPVAYWVSNNYFRAFQSGVPMDSLCTFRTGMKTGDNARFLRLWWEISCANVFYNCPDNDAAISSKKKWFPYNKGGDFRKWYGNNDYVVNFENDGKEIFSNVKEEKRHVQNLAKELRYKECVTWTLLSSSSTAFRYRPQGSLYDMNGMCLFPERQNIKQLIAFANSKVMFEILKITAPTLAFQLGDVGRTPIMNKLLENDSICDISERNIDIARRDWDYYETSWDFKRNPLV